MQDQVVSTKSHKLCENQMSNRVYKKLLNEKDYDSKDPTKSESDNEDCIVPQKNNIFANLNGDSTDSDNEINDCHALEQSKSSISKAKKTKSKKDKKTQDSQSDIDHILEILILNNKDSKPSQAHTMHKEEPLLYIQMKNLNPEGEIKKMFGNMTSENKKKKDRNKHNKLQVHGISPHKETWPPLSKLGLSMEQIEGNASACQVEAAKRYSTFHNSSKSISSKQGANNSPTRYKFCHSQAYQNVERHFLYAAATFSQEAVMALHENHPYHVNTLLQLSSMMRMSDDYQSASLLIEKVICGMESAFHPRFKLTDTNRLLEYKYTENRAFHIALFYHALYLNKRGCPRTALEICKLLLSLDPTDPLGVLLVIDNYALKSKEYDFLIRFYREKKVRCNLKLLPNFAYSIPLAMKLSCSLEKDKKKASKEKTSNLDEESIKDQLDSEADLLLKDAILNFPWILLELLEKGGMDSDDQILQHFRQLFDDKKPLPPTLQRLFKLYLHESGVLWSSTVSGSLLDASLWLEETCLSLLLERNSLKTLAGAETLRKKTEQQAPIDVFVIYGTAPVPANICRHFFLAEHEANAAPIVPPNVPSSALCVYDPFPPADGIDGYKRFTNSIGDIRGRTSAQTRVDVGLNTEPYGATLDIIAVIRSFLVSAMPNVMTEEVLGNYNALAANGELEREVLNPMRWRPNGEGAGMELMGQVRAAMDRVCRMLHLPSLPFNILPPSVNETDTMGSNSPSANLNQTQIEPETSSPTTQSTEEGMSGENNSRSNHEASSGDEAQEDNGIRVIGRGFDNNSRRSR